MNRQSTQRLRLDRRLIDRSDWITKGEREQELDALPDVSHKSMTLGQAEDDVKPQAAERPAPAAPAVVDPLSAE
jgi:hypothetical protein